MKKFIVYGLLFMVSFSFFLLYTIYDIRYTIYAVESTPSSSLNPKLLEEFNRQVASKAAQLKQLISRKLQNKAYTGKIKAISDSSLTLAAKSGPKIVSISQDTEYESSVKKKKYSQKLISEEDFIAALGDIDETSVLIAKKIILLPETEKVDKVSLWGKVVAISDKLITIKNREGKSIAVSLPAGQTVKLNATVLLTGQFSKNEIFEAKFLDVIP